MNANGFLGAMIFCSPRYIQWTPNFARCMLDPQHKYSPSLTDSRARREMNALVEKFPDGLQEEDMLNGTDLNKCGNRTSEKTHRRMGK